MTTRDFIKRRIQLKEQLIVLVRREIEALEQELKDPEPEPDPQNGSIAGRRRLDEINP